MFHLLALFSLLAGTALSQSTCQSYEDGYRQYDVALCPLNATNNVPPIIERATQWIPTSVDTSLSTAIRLNFSVNIYGVPHDTFLMNTNGAIFFGTTGSSTGNLKMPLTYSYGDYLPLVAPLWTDLYYTVGTSTAWYGESGPVGHRMAIIRYSNWHHYTTRLTMPEVQYSFDVIFFEDRPSDIEFRYYRVNLVPSTIYRISVGIQSWNDGDASFVLLTDTLDWTYVSPLLHNKVLTMRYVGTPIDRVPCGGLGYNFESLRGTQLNYTSSAGLTTFVGLCGVVSDPRCSGNAATDKAMICQVTSGGVATDLGVYGPGAIDWQYPIDSNLGVEGVMQSGVYCSGILGQRLTFLAFTCDASVSTATISEVANVGTSTCVTRVVIRTALACNGGSRGNDTELIYPPSTLARCNRVPGFAYTAVLCPRSFEQRRPPVLTGVTTRVLDAVSTGSFQAALPFDFWFYGNLYNTLWIGLNGALYFGGASSVVPTAPPSFGISTPTTFPAIFAYGVSMSNVIYVGLNTPSITYTAAAQTIDGKQAFVVRYENMKYTSFRGLYDMVMNFDIILFASAPGQPGEVEIRYYTISANPLVSVSIGIHGPDTLEPYTAYVPYLPMDIQLSDQLQGAALSFNYTGRTLADACAAFGVNFAGSFTGDIVYTNPDTSLVYRLNPCGPLVDAGPCRNGTSACQIAGTVGTVLTTYNPSGVVWSKSPGAILGVRSTLRDGGYCTSIAAPRTVHIDWVCSRTVSQATFVGMREVSTCLFEATIYSPIACQANIVCNQLTSKYYSGSHCPNVVPALTMTNPRNVFTSANDFFMRIPLGIEFHYYGQIYQYVVIDSIFGLLSFGPQMAAKPMLMAFAAPWRLESLDSLSYSNETIDGERATVIRFRDVEFVGSTRPGNSDAMSFDVLLFEGIEGKVEVRYYVINQPTNEVRISVGTMNIDPDPEEQLSVTYNTILDAALSATFSNSTLRLSYSGPDIITSPCGALGYDLSSLRNADLRYNDSSISTFFSLRVCRPVSDADCQARAVTGQSSLCAKRYNSTGHYTNFASYSEYNPAESYWAYSSQSTGVQLITQSGDLCPTGTGAYTTIFNFVCLSTATSAAITNVRLTGCTYVVSINTNLVCTAGDRNLPPVPPQSTLERCMQIPGSLYNAEICPRAATDSFVVPEVLTSPTRVLVGSNDNALIIPLRFDFYMYDRKEIDVSINTNGLLTFGFQQTNSSSPAEFPGIGLTADNYPVIAPWFTDLINYDTTDGGIPYAGYIEYAYAGTPPSRRVIIRYHRVDYYTTRDSIAQQSASFDVVLTEGEPGGIEIRYYRIDPAAAQRVVVGMVGYSGNNSVTPVHNNDAITRAVAGQMQGTTLTFRYTGIDQPDVCVGVANGYNLSALADRDLYIETASYGYWIRPCATVSASTCTSKLATQRVSACRATLDRQVTTALAGDSPASTTFTISAGALVATLVDGQICQAGVPHRTIVRYVCDESATSPVLDSVDTSVACVHTFVVRSNVLCISAGFAGTQPDHAIGTYNAQLLPVRGSFKVNMTAPTVILSATTELDSGKVFVNTPFNVYMYGEAFSGMWVNVNGWIAFRTGTASTSVTTFPITSTSMIAMLPAILLGSADLYNSNKGGNSSISYSVEGTWPNRFFIVRFDGLNYYATRGAATLPDHPLSYDVKWFENNTNIEVQYWQLTSYTSTMGIGIQGAGAGPMTVVSSGQTVANRGLFMEGQTLIYTYNRVVPIPVSSSSTGPAPGSSTAASSTGAATSTAAPTSSARSSSAVSSSAAASSTAAPSSTAPVGSSTAAPSSSATPAVSSSTVARSSSSSSPSVSSSAAVTSSRPSSTASPATSSPVTPATSSPSSTATTVTSSAAAMSSTASSASSTGSSEVPAGSIRVNFRVNLPRTDDTSSFIAPLEQDIATTIERAYGVQTGVRSHLRIAFGSVTPSRRLLQAGQSVPATLTVFGTINKVVSVDASTVANRVAEAISSGTLETARSAEVAMSVPSGQSVEVEGASKSSSSSLSGGAIAGIVVGVIVGVVLLCLAAFWLCSSTRAGKAREPGSTQLEDENSHVTDDVHHSEAEEMEMQTV